MTDREYFRNRISDHLQKLKLQDKTNPQRNHQSEHRNMKSIQNKLKENDAMITTADKRNSFVILQTQQYNAKIQDFIDKNKFQSSVTDLTKLFQNQIRKTTTSVNIQRYSHPDRLKMEVCKPESISLHDNRSYKTPQTEKTHSPRCKLAERTGIQSLPTICYQNQAVFLFTVRVQCQEHY